MFNFELPVVNYFLEQSRNFWGKRSVSEKMGMIWELERARASAFFLTVNKTK